MATIIVVRRNALYARGKSLYYIVSHLRRLRKELGVLAVALNGYIRRSQTGIGVTRPSYFPLVLRSRSIMNYFAKHECDFSLILAVLSRVQILTRLKTFRYNGNHFSLMICKRCSLDKWFSLSHTITNVSLKLFSPFERVRKNCFLRRSHTGICVTRPSHIFHSCFALAVL